jgi:hypothetical protein
MNSIWYVSWSRLLYHPWCIRIDLLKGFRVGAGFNIPFYNLQYLPERAHNILLCATVKSFLNWLLELSSWPFLLVKSMSKSVPLAADTETQQTLDSFHNASRRHSHSSGNCLLLESFLVSSYIHQIFSVRIVSNNFSCCQTILKTINSTSRVNNRSINVQRRLNDVDDVDSRKVIGTWQTSVQICYAPKSWFKVLNSLIQTSQTCQDWASICTLCSCMFI